MDAVIIFLASYLYLIIVGVAVVAWVLSKGKGQIAILTSVAFPLAYLLSKILGGFILSPRPFLIYHIQPLIHASIDNGFPSDHVLLTATISLIVLSFNARLGRVLCLLTISVGIGRVLARVHHPIDVIGSFLIAIVAVCISSIVAQKFYLQFARRPSTVKAL